MVNKTRSVKLFENSQLQRNLTNLNLTYSRLPNNGPPSPIVNFEKIFACVGTKDGKMYLSITTALLNITKGSNPQIIPPPLLLILTKGSNPPPNYSTPPPPPIIRESKVL